MAFLPTMCRRGLTPLILVISVALAREKFDSGDPDIGTVDTSALTDQQVQLISHQMMNMFDADQNGMLDIDEVRALITQKSGMEEETLTDKQWDQRTQSTMEMMDLDSNGVVPMDEMKVFMRKMSDMDGRLDLLPGGTASSSGRAMNPSQRHKRKNKRKAQRTSGGAAADDAKDEL
uniref:EF-hand domain-containing protein n=1 Tax=Haptolina ericina TaxID=156174 RepID=A0A6T9P2T8_9EUKA